VSDSRWQERRQEVKDKKKNGNGFGMTLGMAVTLTGWPTPTALDRPRTPETMAKSAAFRKKNAGQNTVPLYLGEVAQRAGWPTPKEQNSRGPSIKHDGLWDIAQTVGWGTPTSQDAKHATLSPSEMEREPANLRNQVHTTGWATPTTRDHKDAASDLTNVPINALLGRQASLSPAQTEKRGSLNPAFSLWLMGYPTGWARSAERVTPLSRRSPRSS
jgi:hypothetical protein